MSEYQTPENEIPKDILQKWRRDIVKITPVIKTNCKGENTIGHSAPYPEEIPEMAILFYTGVGDIVLDPFIGSGTTALECIKTRRNYIGFETDAGYCELVNRRIAELERASC